MSARTQIKSDIQDARADVRKYSTLARTYKPGTSEDRAAEEQLRLARARLSSLRSREAAIDKRFEAGKRARTREQAKEDRAQLVRAKQTGTEGDVPNLVAEARAKGIYNPANRLRSVRSAAPSPTPLSSRDETIRVSEGFYSLAQRRGVVDGAGRVGSGLSPKAMRNREPLPGGASALVDRFVMNRALGSAISPGSSSVSYRLPESTEQDILTRRQRLAQAERTLYPVRTAAVGLTRIGVSQIREGVTNPSSEGLGTRFFRVGAGLRVAGAGVTGALAAPFAQPVIDVVRGRSRSVAEAEYVVGTGGAPPPSSDALLYGRSFDERGRPSSVTVLRAGRDFEAAVGTSFLVAGGVASAKASISTAPAPATEPIAAGLRRGFRVTTRDVVPGWNEKVPGYQLTEGRFLSRPARVTQTVLVPAKAPTDITYFGRPIALRQFTPGALSTTARAGVIEASRLPGEVVRPGPTRTGGYQYSIIDYTPPKATPVPEIRAPPPETPVRNPNTLLGSRRASLGTITRPRSRGVLRDPYKPTNLLKESVDKLTTERSRAANAPNPQRASVRSPVFAPLTFIGSGVVGSTGLGYAQSGLTSQSSSTLSIGALRQGSASASALDIGTVTGLRSAQGTALDTPQLQIPLTSQLLRTSSASSPRVPRSPVRRSTAPRLPRIPPPGALRLPGGGNINLRSPTKRKRSSQRSAYIPSLSGIQLGLRTPSLKKVKGFGGLELRGI